MLLEMMAAVTMLTGQTVAIMDQNSAIGILAIIVAGYGVFHTRRQTMLMEAQARGAGAAAVESDAPSPRQIFWKTPGLYALFLLVALAWMPWIFNKYEATQPIELIDYGVSGPITFHGTILTAPLIQYKDTNRVMLLVRVSYSNIDRMRDHALEKTIPYTIDGRPIAMTVAGQINPLRLHADFSKPSTSLEYTAVLIPNQSTPDDIYTLSDVEKGGRAGVGFASSDHTDELIGDTARKSTCAAAGM